MTENDHLKNIYSIQKHLKKDEIVDKVSRLIKSMSFSEDGGMMEAPAWRIKELDQLLHELDQLDGRIADIEINS